MVKIKPLTHEQVDVWYYDLSSEQLQVENFSGWLDPSEAERSARFHFEADRRRFILRHGILRQLLGKYLEIHPAQIQYTYNPFGKPFLHQHLKSSLQFNLSSREDISLFVFAPGRQVGVDVERVKKELQIELIVDRFFSSYEKISINQLPANQRIEGFFNCWTRKEAIIKAVGQGLSLDLNSFDVNMIPGEPARILDARESAVEVLRFQLQELQLKAGYIASLAVEGADWQVSCRRFIGADYKTVH